MQNRVGEIISGRDKEGFPGVFLSFLNENYLRAQFSLVTYDYVGKQMHKNEDKQSKNIRKLEMC